MTNDDTPKPPYETHLRMRDLNKEDMPRERLVRLGRAKLSERELIALFLRTGLPGLNVLELADLLLRKAGSLAELGLMEADEIRALCKGIGIAKAATLAAVFELGKRAVEEKLAREPMRSARAVYDYLAGKMRFEEQETLAVLSLDAQHRLHHCDYVGKGTQTRLIVHPRDVFRMAIRRSASAIIIAHNHPSGDPTPSAQDANLTAHLVEAGKLLFIKVLDHVVIGTPSDERRSPYYSFLEHDRMNDPIPS